MIIELSSVLIKFPCRKSEHTDLKMHAAFGQRTWGPSINNVFSEGKRVWTVECFSKGNLLNSPKALKKHEGTNFCWD